METMHNDDVQNGNATTALQIIIDFPLGIL
jgi:hypothetical protein